MKVVTLNLRADANQWEERLPLVIDVFKKANADVIAVQEVRLRIDQHQQIAEALKMEYIPYLCEDSYEPKILANAIFSRLSVLKHDRIELPLGFRTAQRIVLEHDKKRYCIANTHLHHKPYRDESVRLPQMEYLLDWLFAEPNPIILMGDMNAAPHTETIKLAKSKLKSAYESIHDCEPDVTFPTPLRDGENINPRTIDYIFVSPSLNVKDASVIADTPHPDNALLFPSDHYGLYSEIV